MAIELENAQRTALLQKMASKGFGLKRLRLKSELQNSGVPRAQESRYRGHKIVSIGTGDGRNYRTLETWEAPPIPPIVNRAGEKYFFVDHAYSYRSDRISDYLFNTDRYNWWVLFSNGLFEDEQLKPGLTLRVLRPPGDRIEEKIRRPY